MTKYFNANPISFYTSEIHDVIPPNSIEITDELWKTLLNGQVVGKEISADSDGNPILITPVPKPLTEEQQAAITAKQVAEAKLAKLGLTPDDLKAILG
jgi:hypothetical protein